MQERRCRRDVRRPSLCGDHRLREVLGSCAGEDLPASRLDIERSGSGRELPAKELLIPTTDVAQLHARPAKRSPTLQSDRCRLAHEIIERPLHGQHPTSGLTPLQAEPHYDAATRLEKRPVP